MRRLLVVLIVLAGLLVLADRLVVGVADRAVARQIRSSLQLQQNPDVKIHGFPFLWQAVRGQYDDVEVTIPSVNAEQLHNLRVHVQLHGLHAPLTDVINRDLQSVPVNAISGTVAVNYTDLASASGISGLRVVPAGDGTVTVSGTISLLGQQRPVSAHAQVADHATVGGITLPQSALDVAAQQLTFTVSTRSLPLGLRITTVQAGSDSLTVAAQARDTTLKPGASVS